MSRSTISATVTLQPNPKPNPPSSGPPHLRSNSSLGTGLNLGGRCGTTQSADNRFSKR